MVKKSPAQATVRGGRPRLMWRLFLALTFCAVALARPHHGETQITTETSAALRNILIALDVSRSMLVSDVNPNRLERARLVIRSLLEEFRGDQVGLILFAGTAFLQCPLSSDHDVLREMLPAIGPDYIPKGGTNYDAMLRVALDSFPRQTNVSHLLVVISDGESLDDNWRELLPELRSRGISVVCLGIGTLEGGLVPARDGGYERGPDGAVVLSRLETQTLEDLAKETGGVFLDASHWMDVSAVVQQAEKTKTLVEARQSRRVIRNEIFPVFLWPALLFSCWALLVEIPALPVRRKIRNLATIQDQSNFWNKPVRMKTPLLLLATFFIWVELCVAVQPTEDLKNIPILKPQHEVAQSTPDPERAYLDAIKKFTEQNLRLDAPALEQLASAAISYLSQRATELPRPLVRSVVTDGLAAVARGESIQPDHADWKKLREELEQFLNDPDPRNEQSQNQSCDNTQQKNSADQKQDNQGSSPDQQNPGESSEQKNESGPQQQNASEAPSQGHQNPDQDRNNSSSSPQQDSNSPNSKPRDSTPNSERQQHDRSINTGGEKPLKGDSSQEEEQPGQRPESRADVEKNSTNQQPRSLGGQPVGGHPVDFSSLPQEIREALLRLEQARQNDRPAILFQRMKGDQRQETADKGKNW